MQANEGSWVDLERLWSDELRNYSLKSLGKGFICLPDFEPKRLNKPTNQVIQTVTF